MAKFHVGQAIWAICAEGKWWPGVVTQDLHHDYGRNVCTGAVQIGFYYGVSLPTFQEAAKTKGQLLCLEEFMRPRDDGQFTPADTEFNWREPSPIETVDAQ